jgi:hypothetical protein
MNYNRARTTPTHRLRSRASDRTPSFRPAEGDEAEKAWERTDQAFAFLSSFSDVSRTALCENGYQGSSNASRA